MVAGDNYTDSKLSEEVPVVSADGYDGQFFYRLSLDPFTDRRTEHGVTLDSPSYRHQRIGYPLAVWILTGGGRESAVPLAMLVVNGMAVIVIAFAFGAIARAMGLHAMLGMIAGLYPGLVTSITRDTAEALAAAFLTLGMLFFIKKKDRFAVIAFVLALATRETTILVPASLLATLLWRRESRRALAYLVPIAAFVALQISVWSIWGTLPILSAPGNVGFPFVGLVSYLPDTVLLGRRGFAVWMIQFASIGLIAVLGVISMGTRRTESAWRTSFSVYLILVVSLGTAVWIEGHGFLRASTELFFLGLILVMASGKWARRLVTGMTVGVWALSAYSSLPS